MRCMQSQQSSIPSPFLAPFPAQSLGVLPTEPWIGSSSITPERFTLAAAALARNSICDFDTQVSHCSLQGKVTGAGAWYTRYVTFAFLGQIQERKWGLPVSRKGVWGTLHSSLPFFIERVRTRMQPSPGLSTALFWKAGYPGLM